MLRKPGLSTRSPRLRLPVARPVGIPAPASVLDDPQRVAGAAVVPGVLPERAELDAAGDRPALAVADVLAVASDDQRHPVRRGADRPDPHHAGADLPAA